MNHNVFQILLNGPKYLGAIDSYSSFLFPIVVLLAFELSKNHNIMIANVFMEIHYQMRQYKNCNIYTKICFIFFFEIGNIVYSS